MSDETMVFDTPEKIDAFQAIARRSALKLETLEMKHSRGSVAKAIREFYGLKSRNKAKLMEEFEDYLEERGIARRYTKKD